MLPGVGKGDCTLSAVYGGVKKFVSCNGRLARRPVKPLRAQRTLPIDLRSWCGYATEPPVMATSTPPPDPNALMFPAFMYGAHADCRRKMKAEAKRWGKQYQQHGTFPEPKLIPVPPGSTIFMGNQNSVQLLNMGMKFDMSLPLGTAPKEFVFGERPNRDTPRWFFYLAEDFRSEVALYHFNQRLTEPPGVKAAYEAFACRSPWGVLNALIRHTLYNTIPTVSRRLEALLSFWEKLDSVHYLDHIRRITTLTGLVTFYCQDFVTMWVDAPTGDIRKDLATAVDQMRRPSDDEIYARLVRRLRNRVHVEKDYDHPEWLVSPGVIENGLETMRGYGQVRYDDLTAGDRHSQGSFLHSLAKKYPGG